MGGACAFGALSFGVGRATHSFGEGKLFLNIGHVISFGRGYGRVEAWLSVRCVFHCFWLEGGLVFLYVLVGSCDPVA